MPSQDVGFYLGFQYQTWTLFHGPSIAQILLSYHLWSCIPSEHHVPWRSVNDIRGSSVECMRFAGAWAHSIVHPRSLLVSLHPKSGVFPAMLLPAPTACLPLRLLHSKSYKKRGIRHSSLCRTPSVSPFWTQMVMNLEGYINSSLLAIL